VKSTVAALQELGMLCKAPAGIDAGIAGASGLAVTLTDDHRLGKAEADHGSYQEIAEVLSGPAWPVPPWGGDR
jgi:hypothetical protein